MDLWSNLAIAGNILKTKPLQFSDKLHIEDLSVSVGWLAKFKERFHIKQYHKAEKAIEWIYRLLELVAKELATLLCIFVKYSRGNSPS
ncbi:11973_t:CDS:2 [Entrophospora sp. SA101]|nr:11973_t:CDS:2 [Entrophospora sp. SA101]